MRRTVAAQSIVALALALWPGLAAADAPRCPLPFGPGEHFLYEIQYLGLTAGTVDITLGKVEERGGHRVMPIVSFANTVNAFALYPIHDKFVSLLDVDALRTSASDLHATQGTRRWEEQLRFDHQRGTLQVRRESRGVQESSALPMQPGSVDVAGMFLALRARLSHAAARLSVPVATDARSFEAQLALGPRRSVDAGALGTREVVDTSLTTQFSGKLETRAPMQVLYTADARHLPVQASAEFLLGHVVARLVQYQPGSELSVPCAAAARDGGATHAAR